MATPSGPKSAFTPSLLRRARSHSSLLLGLAGATPGHAPHVADHTDERAAFDARVSFGGALLVAAGAAIHCIPLLQLRHLILSGKRPGINWRSAHAADAPRCSP